MILDHALFKSLVWIHLRLKTQKRQKTVKVAALMTKKKLRRLR